jgi:hypothetical protein
MKLSPQQALEEARKRYPEGTEYIRAGKGYIVTVRDTILFQILGGAERFIIVDVPNGPLYNSETDTWAEIISTPKSLEDRLVDEFGFVKWAFPVKWTFLHGKFITNRYEKDGLSIDYDYENGKVVSIDAKIETPLISDPNPNNLEDFIKAYLRLF